MTLFITVWTNPEPTVLLFLHCIEEVFANLHKKTMSQMRSCCIHCRKNLKI
ncbi:hypothetical protein HanIR_Chr12g0583701 [Helianthus annuus]|nr:hypothetical protein HanIR_Chr12g0583701 [Helianthus annuus]